MRRTVTRALLACAACGVLAGCPEERPGATREIPAQRVPPAMPIEPPPPPPPVVQPKPPPPAAAPQENAAPAKPTRRPGRASKAQPR